MYMNFFEFKQSGIVFLLSPSGRIVETTLAAKRLLSKSSPISCQWGKLVFESKYAQECLQQALIAHDDAVYFQDYRRYPLPVVKVYHEKKGSAYPYLLELSLHEAKIRDRAYRTGYTLVQAKRCENDQGTEGEDNPGRDDLQPREKALYAEVAKGESIKTISKKYGLSERTTRLYIKTIYRKIKARNRIL